MIKHSEVLLKTRPKVVTIFKINKNFCDNFLSFCFLVLSVCCSSRRYALKISKNIFVL